MSPDEPAVTPEMAQRALEEYQRQERETPYDRDFMLIVRAAFTPPQPKPEVVVSKQMRAAGGRYINRLVDRPVTDEFGHSVAADLYTAMELERLKTAADGPPAQPAAVNTGRHRRSTDEAPGVGMAHRRTGQIPDLSVATIGSVTYRLHCRQKAGWGAHRRKDDP